MIFGKTGPRVEAEAAALAAARHPGVVELVDVVDGALRTVRVAGRSLADLPPLVADEVAGVTAAVATTLADLHELGVVHGGIEAGHVLVGADGRVVLCSLGRGGEPADDVAALGRLAGELLQAAPAAPPRQGRRRWARRRHQRPARLGSLLAPPAAPEVAALAARAADPDPARRPTAREVATEVHRRIPTARLPAVPVGGPALPLAPPPARRPTRRVLARGRVTPAAPAGGGPPRRAVAEDPESPVAGGPDGGPAPGVAAAATEPPGGGRAPGVGAAATEPPGGGPAVGPAFPVRPPAEPSRRAVAAGAARGVGLAAVVMGALVAGVFAVDRMVAGGPPSASVRPPARPSPTTTTAADGPVAERVWPEAALDYAAGVLTVDGVRYAVGEPGDAVVAGDWACTGRRTVALLRPASGEVFAFDGWASGGADVTGRPLGVVEGGAGLRVTDADGDGCDDLEVERTGRSSVPVAVRARR